MSEEIVVIAPDRAASRIVPGEIEPGNAGRNPGQEAALDFPGLFDLPRHHLPLMLHFGETSQESRSNHNREA